MKVVLIKEVFPVNEKEISSILKNLDIEYTIKDKREIEDFENQLVIVAEERDLDDNKEYIGYLNMKENKNLDCEYIIENLTVKEERRGLGIGSSMIKYAIKLSKEKGIKNLCCKTDKKEEYLNKFYEKLGFMRVNNNNDDGIIYINDLK